MYKKWFCSKKTVPLLKTIAVIVNVLHNTRNLAISQYPYFEEMAKEGIGTSNIFFGSLFLLFDVLLFIPFVDCKKTIVKQFRVAHKNMHLAE